MEITGKQLIELADFFVSDRNDAEQLALKITIGYIYEPVENDRGEILPTGTYAFETDYAHNHVYLGPDP